MSKNADEGAVEREAAEKEAAEADARRFQQERVWRDKIATLGQEYSSSRPKTEEEKALIRLALHKSRFFTCLDEEQIDRFIQVAELKTYAPGQLVILEGCLDEENPLLQDDKDDAHRMISSAQARIDKLTTSGSLADDDSSQANAEPDDALDLEEEEPPDATAAEEDEEAGEESELDLIEEEQKEDETVVPPEVETFPVDLVARPTRRATELPKSGIASLIYTIQSGKADVWHEKFNTASYGPGTMFGEGGFLFRRQHSASIVASPEEKDGLKCWVVSAPVFQNYVLASEPMVHMFVKYASRETSSGVPYMTMDDFVRCCSDQEGVANGPDAQIRFANTYSLLRKTEGIQRISLADFCLFHILMARPDPETDVAFLLMDQSRTGNITLEDFKHFLDLHEGGRYFNTNSDFVRRHFGKDGTRSIRHHCFSQFLSDFQREMGRQAFLYDVEIRGTPEGYLAPVDFVRVLKTSCGWRLPKGVADRLDNIYCKAPFEAAEAAAIVSVTAEKLKQSSASDAAKSTSASILAHMEQRSKKLGDRYFTYGDFLAFQEVLLQLAGISNLIRAACEIKNGPISPGTSKKRPRSSCGMHADFFLALCLLQTTSK
jgi:CRP-like cAMP-binding protein